MRKGRVHSPLCGVLGFSRVAFLLKPTSVQLGVFWKNDGKTRDSEGRQQRPESCFCYFSRRALVFV